MRPLLLPLVLCAASASAGALDLDLYAQLLERHTRAVDDIAGTRVDYAAVARDPDWRRLVEGLEDTRAGELRDEEELAFWINAYNILAIELVARSHPVESIKDLGSLLRPVWKRRAGTVDGRPVTLGGIEHRTLRPLGDPRIHGAIVCASLSCPPLRREPYRAERLDAQLDDNARRWLADPRKGVAVDRASGTLRLSKIFDWFAEDFEARGGVLAFVERHGPDEARALLRERGERVRIRYLDYDWSLNDLPRESSRRGGTSGRAARAGSPASSPGPSAG